MDRLPTPRLLMALSEIRVNSEKLIDLLTDKPQIKNTLDATIQKALLAAPAAPTRGPCEDYSATPIGALLRDPNWKPNLLFLCVFQTRCDFDDDDATSQV